jgi:hypothetical protein
MGYCRFDSGKLSIICVPRAFNSTVQPCRSSCTSCGSTVLRVHASSHLGFVGAASIAGCCAPFLTLEGPSLPLSLEKKLGIANAGVVGVSRRNAFDLGRPLEKKVSAVRCADCRPGNYVACVKAIERQADGRCRLCLRPTLRGLLVDGGS